MENFGESSFLNMVGLEYLGDIYSGFYDKKAVGVKNVLTKMVTKKFSNDMLIEAI